MRTSVVPYAMDASLSTSMRKEVVRIARGLLMTLTRCRMHKRCWIVKLVSDDLYYSITQRKPKWTTSKEAAKQFSTRQKAEGVVRILKRFRIQAQVQQQQKNKPSTTQDCT